LELGNLRRFSRPGIDRAAFGCDDAVVAIRLLLVDDHPVFRRLARLVLERDGYMVEEAATGRQALQRAAESAPHVALVDVLLPDLDGFAVAEQSARLPVSPPVVLTSWRSPERPLVGRDR
jgi:CheY-like chemotaxis protein